MTVDKIKIKWLELSLKELSRHDEFKNMALDELSLAHTMGVDELRDKYKL